MVCFSKDSQSPARKRSTVPTRSTDFDNSDDSVAGDLSDGQESDSSINIRANASGAESIERERANTTPHVDDGPDQQMSRTSSGGDLDTTHADSSGDESDESSASDNESARSFLEELLNEEDVPLYDGADITKKAETIQKSSRKHPANFKDLSDGRIYQGESAPNQILADKNNLSFSWLSDGFRAHKSSKTEYWPFHLTINELPYEERQKLENLIIFGIWFGENKPVPNLFLLTFLDECEQLYEGIDVGLANDTLVRAVVLNGTGDSPARSLFLNHHQYMGTCGCIKCLLAGMKFNGSWVYPYKKNLRLRTDEETEVHALRAHGTNEVVFGVKGLTILRLSVRKPIRSTGIDIMHQRYGGVTTYLNKLLFDVSYSKEIFSLRDEITLIDARIKNMKPPSFIQRRPRSIEKHSSYWKMSESKNWLFHFGLVILKDIMQPIYYENLKLFALGLFLLNQSSVVPKDVEDARIVLNVFVKQFQGLYGMEYMTSNVS
ncbi:hypothetical protein QAD02_008025 [Eretmocerus hayati]|uniref:Uncharacterized protein n=1 Tax=Eretmocerus hayati TaxID=131215 RepID=A0ACC2N6L8_9HYME|nr:hypothetical protein QAD02_008025 [Eretmocerus hayati]